MEVAERLYHRFAARFATDASTVHRDPYCGYIEPDLKRELEYIGLGVMERIRHFRGTVHRFVETLDGIIIDATWQQFVDPDHLSPDLPKVLFGTREQIQHYLRRLGLLDQIGGIWRDPGDGESAESRDDDDGWGWRGSEPREEDQAGDEEWPTYPATPQQDTPRPRPVDGRDYDHAAGGGTASVRELALTLASIVEGFPIPDVVDIANQVRAMATQFSAESARFASAHLETAINTLRYVSDYALEAASQVRASGEEIGRYLSRDLVATLRIEPANPSDYYSERDTGEHMRSIDGIVARLRSVIDRVQEQLAGIIVNTAFSADTYLAIGNSRRFASAAAETLERCIALLLEVKRQMTLHNARKTEHEAEQRRQAEEEMLRREE